MSSHPVLAPGLATGIGSLPHTDEHVAAAVSLRCTPRLPAAPQLPARTSAEGMIAQWAGALPEIDVQPDGALRLRDHVPLDAPVQPTLDGETHGGLLTFLDHARMAGTSRVKVQLTGPLTLGLALLDSGMPAVRAFTRAAELSRTWIGVLERQLGDTLPGVPALVFLDEPGLVAWRSGTGPLERERAIDLLSGVLAAATLTTGVHVCGGGDPRLALEAGPTVLGAEIGPALADTATALARHLDAGGWVAWGAIPTDGPVGESAEPLWRRMASLWCELARRGCEPGRLRAQALITPACGLVGHGPSQAERALCLAVDLGSRIHSQAVATRLTLGA